MGDRVLELIIRAKDLTGRTVSKFRRNWRAMRRTITNVTRAVVGFTAAVGAAVLGLTKLTQQGENVLAVQEAFARITGNASEALERLRTAARGTISDFRLMALANQALTLGAADSVEQFAEMVRLSRALGRAQGLEATQALEKFTLALARQSAQRADDLGLQLKGIEASKFTAEFMAQARQKADELTGGMQVGAEAAGRFAAAITNARDRLAVLVAESPKVAAFFDGFTNFVTDFVDILSSDSDLIREAFSSLGRIAGNAFSAAFLEVLQAGTNVGESIFRRLEERWAKFIGASEEDLAKMRARVADAFGGEPSEGIFGTTAADAIGNIEAELITLKSIARAARARMEARGRSGGGGGDTGGDAPGTEIDPTTWLRILGDPAARRPFGDAHLNLLPEGAREAARRRRDRFDKAAFPRFVPVPADVAALRGLSDDQRSALEARNQADTVRGASEEFAKAGEIAVASFSSVAAAMIAGSDNIAESMIRMITDITRSIPQVGGLTGALIGGVGGIFGALFSRRRDPVPVRMADIDRRAADKLRDASREPLNVTSIIQMPDGTVLSIEEVEIQLAERQRRNATVRYGRSGRPLQSRGSG